MTELLLLVGYNVLLSVALLLALPYLLYRLRKRGQPWDGIGERFGCYSRSLVERLREGADLWIHAVSVGEVMVASVLLYHLRQRDPRIRVVLTTTTVTGRRVASALEDSNTIVLYNPIDLYWCVSRALRTIRPKLLVLVEAEIWPNYLWLAKHRGVATCLLNARLSPRSYRRYRRFRWILERVLLWLDLVLVQHFSDVERFVQAGFPSEAIFTAGSLKYDVADLPNVNGKLVDRWWRLCGWEAEKDRVFLAGSTHPGEEDILLRTYTQVLEKYPEWKLVLAPRHVERARELLVLCARLGLPAKLRSQLGQTPDGKPLRVLILDTTGELRCVYEKADLVFVGKSLKARGGQNFIEAARVGKPIIVGPYMENFAHLVVEFLSKEGIRQVRDEFELARAMERLAGHPEEREELGKRARLVFETNLGAGRVAAEVLWEFLQHLGHR
ncbi:3-deoxy-D-manno-octulosonic acid transferase [Candidatus Methylacidithermus pantelleriae]|uniref:3-deoxy-D-manno-octulosonic acid transferase n=1 Tax=Candidatus Methylacidithermus pantelleriae TaxID=2744239 RepID=A0A8J2BMA2_9BACT|nr:glycosyltransferase N-terminal domain-containing protein [Candidatus Methylacidithermus pantelleriae]CAF0695848.1 3-deoxy-D-manno-octulosonic acid transferase [Candidatus Methylacidithermus pantelleriae]